MTKKFKIDGRSIREIVQQKGYCLASDRITVDGHPVNYAYREEPRDKNDSGWRFFAGDEDDDYTNNPDNFSFYKVNTIANYDMGILEILDQPIGLSFERDANGHFQNV